jgi:hypothetical protein
MWVISGLYMGYLWVIYLKIKGFSNGGDTFSYQADKGCGHQSQANEFKKLAGTLHIPYHAAAGRELTMGISGCPGGSTAPGNGK